MNGKGNPESRKLRLAKWQIRNFKRNWSKATDDNKRQVVTRRYQTACATLAAHRLLTNTNHDSRSVFERDAERQ